MPQRSYSRRTLLANLAKAAACSAVAGVPPSSAFARSSAAQGQPGGMARFIEPFNRRFRVPAMSIALTRNGRFAFDHAGGMADRQHLMQAQQGTLFRIADLSKTITAVTIFSLLEAGKLHLTDHVFGSSGILEGKYGKPPYKPYVADVTVDHLLTHTAGGWPADETDPMLHNNGWDQAKLITNTIDNLPLTNSPGTNWAYSNFGYCVLGRVIEQLTGQTYEAYVQSTILAPCGITTMQIAHNSERQRVSDEAVYIGEYGEDPYKININRMDSTAGWIASSTELVQFLDHVGGAPGIPSLLKPETVALMTTPAPAYPQGDARYARGCMVAANGSWWHSGSLPGSTALMIRNPDASCSAAVCNTRSQPHLEMDNALFDMLRNMERALHS